MQRGTEGMSRTWPRSRSAEDVRRSRVRPLLRFEAASAANQGGTAMTKPSPLLCQGDGFFSYK